MNTTILHTSCCFIEIIISFGQLMYSIDESNGTVELMITLSNPSSADITVQVVSNDITATSKFKSVSCNGASYHTLAYTYACMHTCTHPPTHTQTYTGTHIHTYTHTCMPHSHMHAYAHMYHIIIIFIFMEFIG